MEMKKGIHQCLLINDSYSNDLHSLKVALTFLKQQAVQANNTLILGELDQSGIEPEMLYQKVGNLLREHQITRLIAIGEQFVQHRDSLQGINRLSFYESTSEFIESDEIKDFQKENILVKGARRYRLERIVNKLELMSHGTVLEINLSAVQRNLNYIRSQLGPEIKVMGMVKAFAYGSGTHEMAKLLQSKVNYLAVAYADEGVTLRKNGVHTPIMVMNAEESSFLELLEYNLEPAVYSVAQLKLMYDTLGQANSLKKPLKIHIELDTGMHRLGFVQEDIQKLIDYLNKNKVFKIQSVFSHLASADDLSDDVFTQKQIKEFDELSLQIKEGTHQDFLRHIENTAGTLRFENGRFDMVRLGIGLYGIDPSGIFGKFLSPVFTFKSIISQIKNIPAGEGVSYGRNGVSKSDRRIAVIALGYADGLDRHLSNGKGYLLIKGKKAPITGRICMDMCMVDVTDIACQEGDEVIVFGKENTIEEMAQILDTIPYEILTSVSLRVKRIFVND